HRRPSPPLPPLFPYTTLFRSRQRPGHVGLEGGPCGSAYARSVGVDPAQEQRRGLAVADLGVGREHVGEQPPIIADRVDRLAWMEDRKSTRLNSSHVKISYAVF